MAGNQTGDIPLKEYVDAKIAELEAAIGLIESTTRSIGVPLREHVEAVWDEQRRGMVVAEEERDKAATALREQTQKALDKADAEREKAAQALRAENQRALDKADVEREKAAHVLREDLAAAIDQGDTNLLNHIRQEIERIREALFNADKLELARIDAVADKLNHLNSAGHAQIEQRIVGVQREVTLTHQASEKAIQKAESANEKRFESVNEFRNSLSDQTASFLPREVAETQFAEMRRSIQELTDKVNKLV